MKKTCLELQFKAQEIWPHARTIKELHLSYSYCSSKQNNTASQPQIAVKYVTTTINRFSKRQERENTHLSRITSMPVDVWMPRKKKTITAFPRKEEEVKERMCMVRVGQTRRRVLGASLLPLCFLSYFQSCPSPSQ